MSEQDSHKKLSFDDFSPTTREKWEEVIHRDLKGADYRKKLIWESEDQVEVRPYYQRQDLDSIGYLSSFLPSSRGEKSDGESHNNWEIRQDIYSSDVNKANKDALLALKTGAHSVCFSTHVADGKLRYIPIQHYDDFVKMLSGIDFSKHPVHFDWQNASPIAGYWFSRFLSDKGLDAKDIQGSLSYDPLSDLLKESSAPNEDVLFANLFDTVSELSSKLPKFRLLSVSSHHFHESSASIPQEVAFTLAAAVEYLVKAKAAGFSLDKLISTMEFSFSVGSNYFFEIAKLRAVRVLWSSVIEKFGVGADLANLHIHCQTSKWNKTRYDHYSNMLRTTTEAMSAVLGGCHSLSVGPADEFVSEPNDLSYRMARNTQLILGREAYLDKVVDPASGSYYIETLTDQIASEALTVFQEIEKRGGFISAIKDNYVQDSVLEVRKKRDKLIIRRQKSFLGTSQFPNENEVLLENIKLSEAKDVEGVSSKSASATAGKMAERLIEAELLSEALAHWTSGSTKNDISLLSRYRGSEIFEDIRLSTERWSKENGRKVKVFLWTQGHKAMRRARATFVHNFFTCGGFEVIDNPGFESVDEGFKEAMEKKPDVVVFCSSDEEYLDIAKEASSQLKKALPNIIQVVAGYPKDSIDSLKELGVDDFVHVKTNIVEFLKDYQKRLRIVP